LEQLKEKNDLVSDLEKQLEDLSTRILKMNEDMSLKEADFVKLSATNSSLQADKDVIEARLHSVEEETLGTLESVRKELQLEYDTLLSSKVSPTILTFSFFGRRNWNLKSPLFVSS
jgi:hypothetical protein